ncbi:MAG: Modulator of FtsH protease HflC [Legionellaceae bacterium]
MNKKIQTYTVFSILVLLIFYLCSYTVMEGQRAILLRLGAIKMDMKTGKTLVMVPGLHFKWPFIEQVRKFDIRLQTLDVETSDAKSAPRIVTREKKNVVVDYYVKWRITDLALYYQRALGQANTLLEQQLNDALRAEFGLRTINEVIADDRAIIMERLRILANSNAKNLGIGIIDVRIKRIDLPEEVSTAIFEQMRAEREKAAGEHRANGKAAAEAIRANADANATIIAASAKAQSAQIRSEGDMAAANIYADAYSKDPEFYAFYRSILAYKNTFANKKDIMVLKPDSKFFKYFK